MPGEAETVIGEPGFVVIRSLTKHWSIPGVRAGYLTGPRDLVADLRREQSPVVGVDDGRRGDPGLRDRRRPGRVRAPRGGDRGLAT